MQCLVGAGSWALLPAGSACGFPHDHLVVDCENKVLGKMSLARCSRDLLKFLKVGRKEGISTSLRNNLFSVAFFLSQKVKPLIKLLFHQHFPDLIPACPPFDLPSSFQLKVSKIRCDRC